jgi:hypothetical protein
MGVIQREDYLCIIEIVNQWLVHALLLFHKNVCTAKTTTTTKTTTIQQQEQKQLNVFVTH